MRDFYPEPVEELMIAYYKDLSEKDRRHYAALEALKLGRGGTNYISRVFRLHKNILIKAKEELMSPALLEQIPVGMQRRSGGGRKKKEHEKLLIEFIEGYKAGSPTDASVYWISLKPAAIARLFYEKHKIKASHGSIKKLLKKLGYGYRKQSKERWLNKVY